MLPQVGSELLKGEEIVSIEDGVLPLVSYSLLMKIVRDFIFLDEEHQVTVSGYTTLLF